jgi:DNA-binding transcriptional LysR family regulator
VCANYCRIGIGSDRSVVCAGCGLRGGVEVGAQAVDLLDDPTMLVVAAEHRVARRREISMAELAEENWIVRAHDHPVGEVLERSCRAAGFTPRIAFHADDYQEAQASVSVELGVALAPRTAVANNHPDIG